MEIRTTLSQNGNEIVLSHTDADYLNALSPKLYYQMAMGISVTEIATENDIGGYCASECQNAQANIKNIKWTRGDCVYESEPEPIVTAGAAPRLDSGECGFGCAECRSDDNGSYMCVDFGTYVYTHMCPDTWD